MQKLLIAALIVAGSASFAGSISTTTITEKHTKTDPTLFLGLTWTFGGAQPAMNNAGISLKILSTNKREALAAAAGVTYNFDGTFGCDIGAGYNFDEVTLTGGWDFCKGAPQMGLGATSKPKTTTTTRVVETPPVEQVD